MRRAIISMKRKRFEPLRRAMADLLGEQLLLEPQARGLIAATDTGPVPLEPCLLQLGQHVRTARSRYRNHVPLANRAAYRAAHSQDIETGPTELGGKKNKCSPCIFHPHS